MVLGTILQAGHFVLAVGFLMLESMEDLGISQTSCCRDAGNRNCGGADSNRDRKMYNEERELESRKETLALLLGKS